MQNDNGKLMISRTTIENLVNVVIKDFTSIKEAVTRIQLDSENNVTVLVDWQTAFNGVIKASGGGISWMASDSIGNDMIWFETTEWWLQPFEYIISKWNSFRKIKVKSC